jgi:hypothetical protein
MVDEIFRVILGDMGRLTRLWLLLIAPVTWCVLFAAFRYLGLTLEKLDPWGKVFAFLCLAGWVVLKAADSPWESADMLLLLSFILGCEYIARSERRPLRQKSPPAST